MNNLNNAALTNVTIWNYTIYEYFCNKYDIYDKNIICTYKISGAHTRSITNIINTIVSSMIQFLMIFYCHSLSFTINLDADIGQI